MTSSDDANPDEAPQVAADEERKPYKSWVHLPTPRKTILGVLKQGVWIGWKWTTIVTGPVWCVFLPISLWFWFSRVGEITSISWTGRDGARLMRDLSGCFGGYAISCFWGIVLALTFCLIVHAVRNAR